MTAVARDRGRRGRALLLGALTSLITTLVLVGGAELYLRVRKIPFKPTWTPSESAMARFDDELGWSYLPERSYERKFGEAERLVEIHFDALGARVASPDHTRDPDRPAVLFVGGSFTMGHGLPYEETFTGVLDADPSVPFEIVNLGVQGYGTDQSLLLLQRYVDRFETVAVVYTFIDKHIRRNHLDDRRLMIPRARFLGTKPLFGLRRDGSPYLRKKPVRFDETIQSNLWNWIRLAWYRKSPPPGPELTEALVGEMAALAASRGARFILVSWRQGTPAWGLPEIDWADPDVLPGVVLELIDTRAGAPEGWDDWTIPGDGHPDERAHVRVADLLRRKLMQPDAVPQEGNR